MTPRFNIYQKERQAYVVGYSIKSVFETQLIIRILHQDSIKREL